MVDEVNWLMLYQECSRAVFCARYCSSLYTSELFSILENKLIGYADDSTLISTGVAVAEPLSRDLVKVCEWCDLWGMELSASNTNTIIVCRSRTMLPQSPALTIGRTVFFNR